MPQKLSYAVFRSAELIIVTIFNHYLFACIITVSFIMACSPVSQNESTDHTTVLNRVSEVLFIRAAYLRHDLKFLIILSKSFAVRGPLVMCQKCRPCAVMMQCKIFVLIISRCTYLICRMIKKSYVATVIGMVFTSFNLHNGRLE